MNTPKDPATEFAHLFHYAQEHGSTAALKKAAKTIEKLRHDLESVRLVLDSGKGTIRP